MLGIWVVSLANSATSFTNSVNPLLRVENVQPTYTRYWPNSGSSTCRMRKWLLFVRILIVSYSNCITMRIALRAGVPPCCPITVKLMLCKNCGAAVSYREYIGTKNRRTSERPRKAKCAYKEGSLIPSAAESCRDNPFFFRLLQFINNTCASRYTCV